MLELVHKLFDELGRFAIFFSLFGLVLFLACL